MKTKRIVSLFMAVVLTIGCISVNGKVRAAEATTEEEYIRQMDAKKEITWPVITGSGPNAVADDTKAQISISANVVDMAETQVLFLGTYCDGHGLDKDTIVTSLNAIAKNADVEYYILGVDSTSEDRNLKKQGHIDRYATITKKAFSNISMSHPRHQALRGFLNTLYDELITKKNVYDYIVLEFDSSRIADEFDYDDYNKDYKGRMDAIAAKLAEYYAGSKVIWITDNQKSLTENVQETLMNMTTKKLETQTSSKTYYVPRKFYYDNYYNYLSGKRFRALCALTAPAYYLANTDPSSTTYYGATKEYTDERWDDGYESSRDKILSNDWRLPLAVKEYSDIYKDNVYKTTSRQLDYNNANELADFLYMAIEAATLEFVDQVHVSGKVKVTGATLYSTTVTSPTNADWTVMSSVTVAGSTVKTGSDEVKYVENAEGTIRITIGNDDVTKNNLVDVMAKGLKSKFLKRVKLVIDVEDAEGFTSCVYWDEEANDGEGGWMMNPNDGAAEIKLYTSETNKTTGTASATASSAAVAEAVEEFTVSSAVTGGSETVDSSTQGNATAVTGGHSISSYKNAKVKVSYTPGTGATDQIITIDGTAITLTKGSYTATDAATGEKITVTADANHNVVITVEGMAKDHSLKVDFVADTTVVYNLDPSGETPEGYTKPADATVTYNTQYDAVMPDPVNGYSFDGWYTDSDLETPYAKANMTGSNYTLTDDHKLNLYGAWNFGLSMEKTADKTSAEGGEEIGYAIKITNTTGTAVTGVNVSDTLDSNLVFVSADNGGTASSGTVTWTGLTVPAAGLTLTLKAKVKDSLSTAASITNTATGSLGDRNFSDTTDPTGATPKKLTVTYAYVGSTLPANHAELLPAAAEKDYGSLYNAEAKSTASGYAFSGWFTDEACQNAYADGTALTDDLDLYGKWELKVSAAKTADKNEIVAGGTLVYSITLKNDTAAKITVPSVSDTLNENLTFVSADHNGTNASGTVTWTDVEVAANSTVVLKLTVTVKDTLTAETSIGNTASVSFDGKTLTASSDGTTAEPRTFKVTYAYKGEKIPAGKTAPTESDQTYGTKYTAKAKSEAAGYSFSGWFTDEACTAAYADGTEIKADLNLYGKWDLKVSAAKTVDKTSANGGDTLVYTVTLKNESAAAVTAASVTDTLDANLTFVSADNGGVLENGTVTWTNVTVPANGTKELKLTVTVKDTLTAASTPISNTASVSFDDKTLTTGSAGTTAAPKQLKVTYAYAGTVPAGAEAVKPAQKTDVNYGGTYAAEGAPVLEGYVFDGWYTDSSCDASKKFTSGTLTSDLNLFGKWTFGLSMEKTANKTSAKGGEEVIYTIKISNATGTAVTGVSVEDKLNADLQFVSASPAATTAPAADTNGTVKWTGLTVPADGLTLTLTAKVRPDLTAAAEIGNTAGGSFGDEEFSDTTDSPLSVSPMELNVTYVYVGTTLPSNHAALLPEESDPLSYGAAYTAKAKSEAAGYSFSGWFTDDKCTAAFTDGTVLTADTVLYGQWGLAVSAAKTVDKTTAYGGDTLVYTITLTNESAKAVTVESVTDTLDANVEYISADNNGVLESGVVTWTNVTVPANGTKTLTLSVKVKGTLTEQRAVSNKASAIFDGKTVTTSSVSTNADPKQLTVSYAYAGTVPAGAEAVKPEDATIGYGKTYTAEASPALEGYVFDGWYTDSSCGSGFKYSSATLTTDVTLFGKWSFGLSMEKTADKTSAVGGEEISYTIRITNTSGTAVTGVSVEDKLNANLRFISASPAATSAPKAGANGTVKWEGLTVPADGLTLTLKAKVKNGLTADASVKNTAVGSFGEEKFSASADQISATPKTVTFTYHTEGTAPGYSSPAQGSVAYGAQYTAVTVDGVNGYKFEGWFTDATLKNAYEQKDVTTANYSITNDNIDLFGKWSFGLSMEKTADKTSAKGGEEISYSIVITNTSGAVITGAEVTDELDANLLFVSASPAASSAPAAGANGTVKWTGLEIPAEGLTLTLKAKVKDTLTADASVGNTAVGTLGSEPFTDTADPVSASPKTLTVSYAYAGTVPAGAEAVKPEDAAIGYGKTYTAEASPALEGYVFDGWYTDSSCGSGFKYSSATLTTDVTLFGKWSFGLSMEKTADKTSAVGGEEISYSIKLTNTTGADITGVAVEDELNENLVFVSATNGGTETDGKVSWTGLTVPAAGLTLTLKTKVSADVTVTADITNSAKATFGDDSCEDATDEPTAISPRLIKVVYQYVGEVIPEGANAILPETEDVPYGSEYTAKAALELSGYNFLGWHLDTAQSKIYPKIAKKQVMKMMLMAASQTALTEENFPEMQDGVLNLYGSWSFGLSMEKDTTSVMAQGGEEVTYTITLTNDTEADVTGVSVSDTLNAALEFVSADNGGTENAGTVSWNDLTVPAKGTLVLTLKAKISETLAASALVTNKATAAFGEESFEAVSGTISATPKLLKVTYAYVGEVPAGAMDVKPADRNNVPYGSEYEAEAAPALAGYVFEGWFSDASCAADKAYTAGVISESLDLFGKWSYGMTMEKTVDKTEAKGGESLTYTILLTNNSAADATGITVTDELDKNLEFISAAPAGKFTETKGKVEWKDLTVPANGSLTLTLTVRIRITLEDNALLPNIAKAVFGGKTFSGAADPVSAKPGTVSIAFKVGSGAPAGLNLPKEVTIELGQPFTPPDMSGKAKGYVFLGWFVDENCTEMFENGTVLDESDVPLGALTLYGKWEQIVLPKTGDTTDVRLWIAVFAISGLGITVLRYTEAEEKRRRRA